MNEDVLQLWLRKSLPEGPIDANIQMASWPKALMVLVDDCEAFVRVASFLVEVAGLEYGRLTLIMQLNATASRGDGCSKDISEETLDARFGGHRLFEPFVRGTPRTIRSRAHSARYIDSSKLPSGPGSQGGGCVVIEEFNSTIKGVLPATVLLVPCAEIPSASMVGTFDRVWLRSEIFQDQLKALRTLLRHNARMLLTVEEMVPIGSCSNLHRANASMDVELLLAGKRCLQPVAAAVEALGLKPHLLGQSIVPVHADNAETQLEDNDCHVFSEPDRGGAVTCGTTKLLRDYLVQLPGSRTNMNFRVSCWCCQ